MNEDTFTYLLPYILSLGLSSAVGYYAWQRRKVFGAATFAFYSYVQAAWTFFYLLEMLSPQLENKLFWDKIEWGTAFLSFIAWWIFTREYTRQENLPLKSAGYLFVFPILFMVFIFTDDLHQLAYSKIWVEPGEPLDALFYDYTPPLWMGAIYYYGVGFLSLSLLITRWRTVEAVYRHQFTIIIVGALITLIGSAATFLLEFYPFGQRDSTAITFAFGNVLVAWGLFRYQIFDLVPIARNMLIDSLKSAVIVVDMENRVVDLNQAARSAADPNLPSIIGQSLEQAFPKWLNETQRYRHVHDLRTELTFQQDGQTQYLEFSISPIRNGQNQTVGRLMVAHDITHLRHSESALRESEERYRLLAENITDFVTLYSPDGKLIYASPSLLRSTGYALDELYAVSLDALIHPDDIAAVHDTARQVLAKDKGTATIEFRRRKKSGGYLWVESHIQAIRDEQGSVTHLLYSSRDITARREAEQAKEIAEYRAQRHLNTTAVMMLVLNEHGEITFVNNKGCEILGYPRDELLGKSWADFSSSESTNENMRTIFRRLTAGDDDTQGYIYYETWLRTGSGEDRLIALHNTLVFVGRVVEILISGEDITDRKRAEEALRQSEAHSRALLNAIPDLVFEIDEDGTFLNLQADPSELAFATPGQFIGRKLHEIFPPEHAEMALNAIRETLSTGQPHSYEYQLPIPEKGTQDYEARVVVSGPHQVLVLVRNITQRKRAEEALQISEAQLKEAQHIAQLGRWELDMNTGKSRWSQEHYHIFGLPEDTPITFNYYNSLLHPEDVKHATDSFQELLDKRVDSYSQDYRIIRPDGEVRHVTIRARISYDEHGFPQTVTGITQDITERKQAEAALRQSEERFKKAFEASPIGMALVSPEGKWLQVNPSLTRMLGYTEGELLDLDYLSITHPEELQIDLSLTQQLLRGEIPAYRLEKRYFHKSGKPITTLLSVALVRDMQDTPLYLVSQIVDITELKQMQIAVLESNARYNELVRNIPGMVYVFGRRPDGTIFYDYVSPRCKELNGVEPEAVYRDPHVLHDQFLPEHLERHNVLIAESARTLEPFYSIMPKLIDGEIRWRQYISLPKQLDDGTTLWHGIETDITQQRKTEEALRESQRFIEQVTHAIPDIVYVFDLEERTTVYNNRHLASELGYSPDEIKAMQTSLYETIMPPEERRRQYEELMRFQTAQDQEVRAFEFRCLHKNGDIRWRSDRNVVYARHLDGSPKQILGVSRDITEQKAAQEWQAKLMTDLENANRDLKDFAYIVSHDLKAPLRGISTVAGWLTSDYADKFDDEGHELLELLSGRVKRMEMLINGVLEYSRIGRISEKTTDIDLNTLLPEIIDLVVPKGTFDVKIATPLPTIKGEPTRVMQVFQNLLSNAVKFMDKPAGRIRVDCEDAGSFWQFRVSDNGPGIEERHFARIFQIFQTLTPRDEHESTGVGLTIAKRIVELYGGKIWVESKRGEGTTFHFTLPRGES